MWKLKVLILSIISLSIIANPINEELGQDAADEVLSYRLPNNTVPISYEITIETKIHENNFEFNGNVKILVEIVESTDSITLHSRQLEIDKIDLFVPNGDPIILDAESEKIESHDFLIIKLPTVYNASDELLLDIAYHGNLRDDFAGFYRYSYYNNGAITWYAATQFQMDNARHAMPCFDEPGFRATMKLSIKHGNGLHAVSNTEVAELIPDGTYVTTKFAETPVMPTYLLAFIVSNFEYVTPNDSRISQKFYGRPELVQNSELDFAASTAGNVLSIFESILTPKYNLTKMDHVAVSYPIKYIMENFGMIVYDEYALNLYPGLPEAWARDQKEYIIRHISKAFAMQWFGNTVSPKWWQYVWLSEGFGSFFKEFVPYLIHADRSLLDSRFTAIIQNAFGYDSFINRPLNYYVEHPDDLWGKLSETVDKSACILRMFMEAMTEDVFMKGLNYYLTDNFMQSVTPAEFHKGLQQAYDEANTGAPLNIGIIMETWEDQAGFPLISVSVSGSNLVITQRRLHENSGETYTVPLTFATKSYPIFTPRTKTWLPLRAMSYPQASLGFAPGDWIILNINQVGYYKVDYDRTLWLAIIDQLKEDHAVVNPINREVLQEEFFMAWFELERVNGGDALFLLSYFHEESNPAVWNRAYELLRYLKKNLFGTAAYDEFLKMLQQMTKPHLVRLGYDDLSNDTSSDSWLRSITKEYNCLAIDGDCVSRDLIKLIQFFSLGRGNGDFNFCNALAVADRTTYSEIVDKVISDRDLDYRWDYIWGLGCSIIPENLERSLEAVLDKDNKLDKDEREYILQTMATKSSFGLKMCLDFMDEHYMELYEVLDYNTPPIIYIAPGVKEKEMIEQFGIYMTKLLNARIINADEHQFYNALVSQNQYWLDKNYHDIKVYFGLDETTTTNPTTTSTTESTVSPTTTIEPPITEPITTTIEPPTTMTEIPETTTTELPITTTKPITTTQPSTSISTTPETTTQPTTNPSTSPQPEPATTPGSGNSIAVTLSLIFGCLLIQLVKML